MKLLFSAILFALTVSGFSAETGFTVTVQATGKDGLVATTTMPNLGLWIRDNVRVPLRITEDSKTVLIELDFNLADKFVQYDIMDGERLIPLGDGHRPVQYAAGVALLEFGKKIELVEMDGGSLTLMVSPPAEWKPDRMNDGGVELSETDLDTLQFEGSISDRYINGHLYNPTNFLIKSITVRVEGEKTNNSGSIERLYDLRISVAPNSEESQNWENRYLARILKDSSPTVTLEKAYGIPRK